MCIYLFVCTNEFYYPDLLLQFEQIHKMSKKSVKKENAFVEVQHVLAIRSSAMEDRDILKFNLVKV